MRFQAIPDRVEVFAGRRQAVMGGADQLVTARLFDLMGGRRQAFGADIGGGTLERMRRAACRLEIFGRQMMRHFLQQPFCGAPESGQYIPRAGNAGGADQAVDLVRFKVIGQIFSGLAHSHIPWPDAVTAAIFQKATGFCTSGFNIIC